MSVIAVVGAGTMGADVALLCASYGHHVILKDIEADALESVRTRLPQSLRGYRMLGAALKSFNAAELLDRIRFELDFDGFAEADWVIENVPEDWETKRAVYAQLREHCHPQARYAVNTSCLSVTRIAALMPDPQRVIGAHFMNPVPLKKAVEVIRGRHTSDETVAQMKVLLQDMGRNAIVVRDFPGFVSNRLSHLFMNEAAFLVQDGVAAPAEIDAVFREGYSHRMGPLETADLIGLDTVVKSLDVLYQSYRDSKFRCCPLLSQMVDAGELGRKSGKGFYVYGDR